MKRMLITVAALTAAFAALAPAPAVGGSRTLVVDDDRQQCPRADFTSISAAIAAANPGATIKVCPGLYLEQVVLDKPRLELRGATRLAAEACLRGDGASDPAANSVIHGRVRLEAQGTELDGVTVELAPGGEAGVYTSPAFSGYDISRNVIQQNEGGINLSGDGNDETRVVGNCIRSNNENDPAGLSDIGLFSEQGLLHDARIEANSFTGQLQGSMFLGYGLFAFPTITAPSTDITIARNVSVDDGDEAAVFLNNVQDVDVSNNKMVRIAQGVAVFPPASDVVVEHNDIEDALFFSIRVDGDPFGCCTYPSGPTNIVVARNDILRSGSIGPRDGILLFATSGQTVVGNEIRDSYRDGISIRAGSSGNLIAGNYVVGSGRDGIRNRDVSAGNRYVGNRLFHNVEHDAHDDNRPANAWVKNHCQTDFPDGTICDA